MTCSAGRPSKALSSVLLKVAAFGLGLLLFGVAGNAGAEDGVPPKVSPSATYTGDVAVVLGGQEPGFAYMDNLDLTLSVHLEPIIGWPAELFLYALGNQGTNLTPHIGDLQTADNIEGPTNFSVFEAWYEHRLFGQRASLLVGLYDINSEFDYLHSANLFVGSSFGLNAVLGASGRNGPSSFPVNSLAARFKVLPLEQLYVQATVLDGVPGDPERPQGTHIGLSADQGALVLFETGLLLGSGEKALPSDNRARARRRRAAREDVDAYRFKLASGNWWYTSRFDDLRGPEVEGSATNFGGYFAFDALLWRDRPGIVEGLSAHGRFAYGNPRYNAMHVNLEGGVTYSGLVPGRPGDESGLGWSTVLAGQPYRQAMRTEIGETPTAETVVELTHLFLLNDWFSLQLDAQFIKNPGMLASNEDALLLLTRLQGAF